MPKSLLLSCKSLLSLILISSFFFSCTTSSAQFDAFSYKTLDIGYADKVRYEKLELIPIYLKREFESSPNQYGNYITLSDALKNQKVEISEKSVQAEGSDDVNKLYIENKSKDTIFLMAGEIVKGGKQDRTLAQDVLLVPGNKKIDIDVFCVEHGRWSPKDENRAAGVPDQEMKFGTSAPVVKNSVRKSATVEKTQSSVWNEVTSTNGKANNVTATDAYTSIEQNENYQNQEKKYLDYMLPKLKDNKRIIGFVAITGNRIIGCDIFATHSMFNATLNAILPSYINEAIHDGAVVNISESEIKSYLNKLLQSEKMQKDYLENNGKYFKDKSRPLHLNAY